MTVSNLTALIFAMGRQGGTLLDVARSLGVEPYDIIAADDEKMGILLRMAQKISAFRPETPHVEGLVKAVQHLKDSLSCMDWDPLDGAATAILLEAAETYLERMEA